MTGKLHQLLKRQRVDPNNGKLKLRKRTKARAHTAGQHNRRIVKIRWAWDRGPNSDKTREPIKKELFYHFTKGYRWRTA